MIAHGTTGPYICLLQERPAPEEEPVRGPGWQYCCRQCFGVTIEWRGLRRCECEEPDPVIADCGKRNSL